MATRYASRNWTARIEIPLLKTLIAKSVGRNGFVIHIKNNDPSSEQFTYDNLHAFSRRFTQLSSLYTSIPFENLPCVPAPAVLFETLATAEKLIGSGETSCAERQDRCRHPASRTGQAGRAGDTRKCGGEKAEDNIDALPKLHIETHASGSLPCIVNYLVQLGGEGGELLNWGKRCAC